MNTSIFWDITPCSPLKVNGRFVETSPSSSGSKNKTSKKMEVVWYSETSVDFQRTTWQTELATCFHSKSLSYITVLRLWRWRRYVFPKRQLTFSGLLGKQRSSPPFSLFFLMLFFDSEDGGNLFLRNVRWFSADYMENRACRLLSLWFIRTAGKGYSSNLKKCKSTDTFCNSVTDCWWRPLCSVPS
jgi:hypothetical protein